MLWQRLITGDDDHDVAANDDDGDDDGAMVEVKRINSHEAAISLLE